MVGGKGHNGSMLDGGPVKGGTRPTGGSSSMDSPDDSPEEVIPPRP